MEFRVLGPLEVRVHDRSVALGGTRPRAVLAALLLGRNAVVPVERLITAIWGESPPGTPTAQIQAAVSALRKVLGADRIVTRAPGYLLRVDRGELDLDEFDREVAAARRMREEGSLGAAADGLRTALQWWRDDALVDLAELPVRSSAVAVDERRWVAWEERIEVDLALRRHADLVPELLALVTRQPLRDRLWTQLMRAQYRCGRRAEALETYQRARRIMRDELGLEPAAELIAVHDAILADDPALDPDVLPLGPRPEWVRPPCPYRALEAYRPDDAEIFHGRRAEVAAVVERARAGPVTVVGPSGSGKSSLVLAGVLPALVGCAALVVRPTERGRVDLALAAAAVQECGSGDPDDVAALAEQIVDDGLGHVVADVLTHTGAERVVVVLDQAEELLTQDAELVDAVLTALFEPALADQLTVIATLRADFLSAVLERSVPGATLGGRGVFTLGAMGREQLREAVTAPVAQLDGITFEPGLVDRVLGDVGSEPGALALLGLTLTLLWNEQVDGTLTHEAYDDLGRVSGALATHAEGVWRRLNLADDELTLRRLVGHLVRVDAAGRVTRRVALRTELDEQAWRLAVRLSPTRMVVVTGDAVGEQTVELAHEALITHWPRLSGWIESDAGFHAWRTVLRGDLDRWQGADRDPALLVRGAVLDDARRWCADHDRELGAEEIDFVRRSEHHERTAGRRTRTVRAGLVFAAVLVLILGVVFVEQRSRTADAAAEADSRALAARSVAAADQDPRHAALLAVAAHDRAPTAEARDALFARYRDVGRLAAIHAAHGVEPGAARASADGRVVAATSAGGSEFTIWVRREGGTEHLQRPRLSASNVEVAPDGSAVWLLDPDGIARLDVASGATRTVVPTSWSGVPQLALSLDGTRILLRDDAGAGYRVREWSTSDGRERSGTVLDDPADDAFVTVRAGRAPGAAFVEFMSYSPATYRIEALNLTTGERQTVASGASGSVASDRSAVVTCALEGAGEGAAAVLTGIGLADGTPIGRRTLRTDASACPLIVVGPRGRVVAKGSLGDLRVVDLARGTEATVEAFSAGSGLSGPVPAMVTSDGSRLLTTGPSWIGVVDLTDPETTTRALRNAEVSDDGSALVGVSEDGGSLVATPLVAGGPDAAVTRPSSWTPPEAAGVAALVVGPSSIVADRIADRQIALHRLPRLDPLATVTLPAGRLDAMYFDAADRLVTVVDQVVLWWDADTGTLRHRLDLDRPADGVVAPGWSSGPTVAIAAMPDPKRIAVHHSGEPDVTVRDVVDGRAVDTLPLGADVERIHFQRSSPYVLVSRPTTTEVWDSGTKRRVVDPLAVGDGVARVAAMAREPGHFLTFDLVSGDWRLTTYRVGAPGPLTSFRLGPYGPGSRSGDGGVITLDRDDATVVEVLRLDPAGWRRPVCAALAGADLTAEDRAAHPDLPPGPVCGDAVPSAAAR